MTEPLPIVRTPQAPGPPLYGRVAIVGLGLIGGSIALAVRRRWPSTLVIGVDRKEIVERATVRHAIDVGAEDVGMAADADLVILAAPVRVNLRSLSRDLPGIISRETTITDVGSTKREMLAASRTLPAHLTFIGGHPIAGAAVSGLEHARADLFDGRPWVLCAPTETERTARLEAFVEGLGSTSVKMSADDHDALLAYISHLPQLVVSALMRVIGDGAGARGLSLAGRGLKDTTRLAGSAPEIWTDIGATNADNLRAALDALIESLQQLRDDLEHGDVLQQVFEAARAWKSTLDQG